jgi:hypothetical protein
VGLVVQLAGALMVLGAFALLQLGRTTADARSYLLLNAVGSATLAANAAAGGQWGFVLLNVTWLLVSLWSLLRPRPGSRPAMS